MFLLFFSFVFHLQLGNYILSSVLCCYCVASLLSFKVKLGCSCFTIIELQPCGLKLFFITLHMYIYFLCFFRYYQVGVVVLFLHDICDVFLEFTKICICFKIRDKKKYYIFEVMINIGFLLFSFSW